MIDTRDTNRKSIESKLNRIKAGVSKCPYIMEKNSARHVFTISSRSSQYPFLRRQTGGQTKEEVIETNERLRVVRIRLDGSYDTAKRALVELMCKYTDSKQVRNVFQRYNLLKVMIKVRRGKYTAVVPFVIGCSVFVPPTLCARHVSVPDCRLSVDVIT